MIMCVNNLLAYGKKELVTYAIVRIHSAIKKFLKLFARDSL